MMYVHYARHNVPTWIMGSGDQWNRQPT